MKTLPIEFTAHKSTFKMLSRVGDTALYERSSKAGNKEWEVVKIRIKKEQTIGEYEYPEQEQYPSASQWGVYGWTSMSLENAKKKFEEVCIA